MNPTEERLWAAKQISPELSLAGLVWTLVVIAAIAITLYATRADAGIKEWCAKILVAEDPYPYAELSTQELFELPRGNEGVFRELLFRYRARMFTKNELHYFESNFITGVGE